MPVLFISGIDTGIGKTIVTGLIARSLLKSGKTVITQKIVQTGCKDIPEDIVLHRKIMGVKLTDEDKNQLTCPYIFKLPASPHLAASLEGKVIDQKVIKSAADKLLNKYEYVLIEGAGGLHVPLSLDYTILDYIQEYNYPTVLISSPKLGSINHTLLSLEIAKDRKIDIRGIIYNLNTFEDEKIANDSKYVFKHYLKKFGYPEIVVEVPLIENNFYPLIDFFNLF